MTRSSSPAGVAAGPKWRARRRSPARAGILLQFGAASVAFSLNWLSKEFQAQPEGQAIGALSLKYRF